MTQAATQAANEKTAKEIHNYAWYKDEELMLEGEQDQGALLAAVIMEMIGRKFGNTYKGTLLDHEIQRLCGISEQNALNPASAMYQCALIGLQSAITNDGFEPYSVKSHRDIAGQSLHLDTFLLTVMKAADEVYSKASRRLPADIRDKIWAHKHAGQHEQACSIACRYLDVTYLDTFDRKKFQEWGTQAVDQVQSDQEAYTIFTYGVIGRPAPILRPKQDTPPPRHHQSKN